MGTDAGLAVRIEATLGKPEKFTSSIKRIITHDVRVVGQVRDRTLEFIGSDETVDRYRDIISVEGWDIKAYKQNPVFLAFHDSRNLPVGKSVKTFISDHPKKSNQQALMHHVLFATPGKDYAEWPADKPTPETMFRMYMSEFLRAVSVGFLPKKYEPIMAKVGDNEEWTGGYRFIEQELLELSGVSVPANPNALINNSFDPVGLRQADVDWIKVQCEKTLAYLERDGKPKTDEHALWKEALAKVGEMKVVGTTTSIPNKIPDFPEVVRFITSLKEEGCTLETDPEEMTLAEMTEEVVKAKKTDIQSVICSKEKFKSAEEAKKWCSDNGFKTSKVDETGSSYRFRQFDPEMCTAGSFRTIKLTDGVKAVICKKKGQDSIKPDTKETLLLELHTGHDFMTDRGLVLIDPEVLQRTLGDKVVVKRVDTTEGLKDIILQHARQIAVDRMRDKLTPEEIAECKAQYRETASLIDPVENDLLFEKYLGSLLGRNSDGLLKMLVAKAGAKISKKNKELLQSLITMHDEMKSVMQGMINDSDNGGSEESIAAPKSVVGELITSDDSMEQLITSVLDTQVGMSMVLEKLVALLAPKPKEEEKVEPAQPAQPAAVTGAVSTLLKEFETLPDAVRKLQNAGGTGAQEVPAGSATGASNASGVQDAYALLLDTSRSVSEVIGNLKNKLS